MKGTKYIAKITTQKAEKYLFEGRKLGFTKLVAWSLRVNQNFFRVSLLQSFFSVFDQSSGFISRGIGRSYFPGNFLLSLLLLYDFKILFKSRGGGTFL